MQDNAQMARSSCPDIVETYTRNPILSLFSRKEKNMASKHWKPTALRAPILIFTLLMCWSLIAVLQIMLTRSQRDSGVIFAPRISDLPLSQTFLYLYFPTILAVIFSIYWAWIDLEAKRMEPYYQLSKENGALGKDSLLLHYPFDFIPLVPLKALRDRHWPVFWASLAVVLVTWGLVPTQAGIFSVRTITRTTNMTFSVSTPSIPVEQQASALTFRYAQSAYAITTLNETLPPYMARNYTLAPFKASIDPNTTMEGQDTWTAVTTMYSLDLFCENVTLKENEYGIPLYASSNGCNFTSGINGNITVGDNLSDIEFLRIKGYTGQFVGYHNSQGYADYYLSSGCPKSANHTFFAAFTKNKERKEDPPQAVTAVYCTARYYQQLVSATVETVYKRPLRIRPVGEQQPLAPNIFNTTVFEELLGAGSLDLSATPRGDNLPSAMLPKYMEPLSGMDISLTSGFVPLQPMVGMSLCIDKQPLTNYLDWKILSKSYADAYRLIFARAMVEVVRNDFTSSEEYVGQHQMTTEAVLLEPIFVFVVEGLLGVVSLATIALLYLSCTRRWNLRTDPTTIASIMSIVSDNQPLLAEFAHLDCCTVEDMQNIIGTKRFRLVQENNRAGITEAVNLDTAFSNAPLAPTVSLHQYGPMNIAKPVRPREFSIWVAFPFVNLFIILAVALGVMYKKAYAAGFPLPSTNSIVQNLLENYIPTSIATMIEPMWILVNRLLCMLQPLEELQSCNARAKKSIDLDYSSLPPQLVVFRAVKSGHFVLAAVCAMALLANVLAVALSGLFNHGIIDIRRSTYLYPPYHNQFVPIDGTIGPQGGSNFGSTNISGAYRGGKGEDQFLIAESNYTEGTPLPAWTDDTMFYMPLFTEGTGRDFRSTNGSHFEAETIAFGADLSCTELEFGNNFNAALFTLNEDPERLKRYGETRVYAAVNVTIPKSSGNVRCSELSAMAVRPGTMFESIPKDINKKRLCTTGPGALELVFQLRPPENSTQEELDACLRPVILGWVRDAQGSCPMGRRQELTKDNSLFIQCQPRLRTGTAKIRVDASGRLQRKAQVLPLHTTGGNDSAIDDLEHWFSNGSTNLIGQSNNYLFRFESTSWHNDSIADNFINYFIRRASNSRRLIDPTLSVPTFDDVLGPLNKAYSNLFAIWLGTNKENLLVSREGILGAVEAWRIEPEKRLFLSTPMFALSEGILCLYIIVAITMYMRRPGQYLARLPTTIASVIALFAASAAVSDMEDASHLDKKGRAQHLETVDARYGYGTFVGSDGQVHIGIEKTPFVRFRSRTTWLEKRIPLFRKRSAEA